jgi:uncharacterized membrane protein
MRVERGITIDRPVQLVFDLVSDATRLPDFFVGLTRWEPATSRLRGKGARFRVRMKVGSIEAGGEIRIARWEPPRLITWESVRGISQRGAWRLREVDSRTELRVELEYDLSGGPLGWVADRLVGRIVGRNLTATVMAARRLLERDDVSR